MTIGGGVSPPTDVARPGTGSPEHRRRRLWAAGAVAVLLALGYGPRRERRERPAVGAAAEGRTLRRGWKARLLALKTRITDDRATAIAGGITYFTLLAIFPALAALVSLYGLFANPASVNQHLETVSGVVPGGGMEVLRSQVTRLASQSGGALSFAFVLGLLVSLWSANAATKALFSGLNVVYDEKESRSFFKLTAITLLFTLGGILFLLCAMAALIVLPAVFAWLGLGGAWELLVTLGRWPILVVAIALILALIYRFGPDRSMVRWRWITWGSAFASLAWLVLSLLFSWYAANFGNYNKTYGSLGAVIGFMTWMWLSATVVLVGAEIDAEMEAEEKVAKAGGSSAPAEPIRR